MVPEDDKPIAPVSRWYDLFSRGARDWLRHNQKIRDAVRASLPDVIADSDLLGGDGGRTVQVPVRFLEHYRFRLRNESQQEGVGQGEAGPGDVLRQGRQPGEGQSREGSGSGEGGVEFVVEMKVDEIIDWLWEEMQLPHLKPKEGVMTDAEYTREGWDKRGARARLDRRRTLREAIKRRAVQPEGPPFSNEDLRFRQLVKRDQPTTQAVIVFAMDVSSSMAERDRKLAKSFFFWAMQGLRRQYSQIEPVFIAHTIKAWEFPEDEFFQVRGQGGTVASAAFSLADTIVRERFDPSRYNVYLFYASDGENFREDREAATEALRGLAGIASFMGFIETNTLAQRPLHSETADLFRHLAGEGAAVDSYGLSEEGDVWDAIRAFFRRQVERESAAEV